MWGLRWHNFLHPIVFNDTTNNEITYPNPQPTGVNQHPSTTSTNFTSWSYPSTTINYPAHYPTEHPDPGDGLPPTMQQFCIIMQHCHILLADHAYSPSYHNHVQTLFWSTYVVTTSHISLTVPCYETALHSLLMCSLPSYRQSTTNVDQNVAFYLYNVLMVILTTCYTSEQNFHHFSLNPHNMVSYKKDLHILHSSHSNGIVEWIYHGDCNGLCIRQLTWKTKDM